MLYVMQTKVWHLINNIYFYKPLLLQDLGFQFLPNNKEKEIVQLTNRILIDGLIG